MFGYLHSNIESIIETATQIAYFMRGGVTYDDVMFRTPGERDIMIRFLEKRIEAEMKMGQHMIPHL